MITRTRAWLIGKCDEKQRAALTDIVSSSTCGWLINERVVNLPVQLLPPLLDALVQDVNWARTNPVTNILPHLSCLPVIDHLYVYLMVS